MKATNSADTDPAVIAHFAKTKTILITILGFALIGLDWKSAYYHPAGMSLDAWYASKSMDFHAGLISTAILGIALLIQQAGILKRLLFHDGSAIWRDGDKIIFMSERAMSADMFSIADIEAASIVISPVLQRRSLVVKLRSGGTVEIPTGGYSEPAAVVLASFRDAAGLG